MRKFKLLLLLIVLALIGLGVWQNLPLFQTRHTLKLNLGITQFHLEAGLGVLLLAFFLAGLLIAYFFSLFHRFKSRKTIRSLNEQLEAERKKAADLESRLSGKPQQTDSGAAVAGAAAEGQQTGSGSQPGKEG
ncbi:MAG: lipopolysaccharide assembly protein LapA domain-containing protein [Desulfosalsimonadaceae bacterium]